LAVLEHPDFVRGDYDTHFLEKMDLSPPADWEPLVAAAAAIHRHHQARRRALAPQAADRSAWRDRGRRANSAYSRRASEPGSSAARQSGSTT